MSYLYSSTPIRTTQDIQVKPSLEPHTYPAYFRSCVSKFTAIAYTDADKARFRKSRHWLEISGDIYDALQPIEGGAE